MPTQNSDIRYRLIGQDVSAGSTFRKVAGEASTAHSAISSLGRTLQSTGAFAPFMQGIDAISQGFQHIQENGKSARVVMQGIGIGTAAVGAALLGLGASAQQAHAGLQQAILDTGNAYTTFGAAIDSTVAKAALFGHQAADTENALARLTTAVQDPAKALSLMGLAANIAAARNINLTSAAQMLTSALAGNTRVFRQFGINVGTGKLSADALNKALDELNQRLSGRAQAQADTFSGRIKGIAVEFENATEKLTKFAPVLLFAGASMTVVSSAWDLLAKKKAENLTLDTLSVASSRRVAVAEARAATAGLADLRAPSSIRAVEAGSPFLFRSSLLRAGGLAAGGLITGGIASAALGGQTGSGIGDALSGAGVGAGIGTLIGPEGTIIGGAAGLVAGALYGGLHHGSTAKFAQMQKNIAAQQQQQTAITFSSYIGSEIDPLGNPKAAKVASATEALAKAKTRLARAQEDLNKQESKSADPLKLAAAAARLTAAQDSLRKAEYTGKGVAAAQAAIDSAQATINGLHAGTDTTAAQRRITDAKQAVTDAQRRVHAARTGAAGLTPQQFFRLVSGNAAREDKLAADQQRLVDLGASQPLLAAADASNQQHPGTLHALAGMGRAYIERLNRQERDFQDAAQTFTAVAQRAYRDPARALGAAIARDQMQGYNRYMRSHGLQGPVNLGSPYQKPHGLGGLLAGGISIQTLTVKANDPNQFTQQLNDTARHKALAVPHGA